MGDSQPPPEASKMGKERSSLKQDSPSARISLASRVAAWRKELPLRQLYYESEEADKDDPPLGITESTPYGSMLSQRQLTPMEKVESLLSNAHTRVKPMPNESTFSEMQQASAAAAKPSLLHTEVPVFKHSHIFKSQWQIPSVLEQCPSGKGIKHLLVIVDHTNDRYRGSSCGQLLMDICGMKVKSIVLDTVEGLCTKLNILVDGDGKTEFAVSQEGILLRAEGSRDNVTFDIFVQQKQELIDILSVISFVIASIRPAIERISLAKLKDAPWPQELPYTSVLSDYVKFAPFAKEGQSYCWTQMIEGATVVRNFHTPSLDRSNLPGLMLDFPTLISLAAVHSEVFYDNGIILVGFQTALIPLCPLPNQPSGSTRWHFATSNDGKQITYNVADPFDDERLKVRDTEQLQGVAFVGWCAEAVMTLGSNLSNTNIERSDAIRVEMNSKKKALWAKQILMKFEAVPLFSATFLLKKENAPSLPTRAIFAPQSNHTGIMNEAKEMYHIIYDDMSHSEKAWLTPAINLLLYCIRVYLCRFEYVNPSPCFNLNYPFLPKTAEEALTEDMEFRKVWGSSPIRLHALVAHLWMRIVSGNHLRFDYVKKQLQCNAAWTDQYLCGFELYDVAGEGDFELKEVAALPATNAWIGLTKDEVPVIFCRGIGEIIKPKDVKNLGKCGGGLECVPGVLTCINQDLMKAFKVPERHWAQVCDGTVVTVLGPYEWVLKGNPFDQCDCSSMKLPSDDIRYPTCWSSKRLQCVKISGGLKFAKALGLKTSNEMKILPKMGAVRFGFVSPGMQ